MTTFTWNITHAWLMVVEERCVYCAVQEFGLAPSKSSVTKTMKGFEQILAKLQGEAPSTRLVETAQEAKRAKDLSIKAAAKQPHFG
ncbi:PRELI domain-containing protein 1, mitochondrial [Saguinus oedipus]|uniref:PRELI domain-containing protein 1, mitochondrial n=1 Tax=Saguinus oedipus TaxID=9490 RepID=A0ABQ9VUK9_SAGOE|nr:PRELI domain-containing protein 1, mitochondrial [Saguinus oedipus]